MFSTLLSLAILATLVNAEYWIFGGTQPLIQTRLDPLVNPGAPAGHVHNVVGGSNFGSVYDRKNMLASDCSTISVQQDKSNYWAPQLYHRDQATGHLTPMKTSFNIYYLRRPNRANERVMAFPEGLRMLAGDNNELTYNASSFADQAVSYVCMDYSQSHANDPEWAERPDFFHHNCPDGLRAQVFFPSCWNGKDLDSPDHKSHMSYPVGAYNAGDCPVTHPVKIVSLFYEMIVSVSDYPYYGDGTWVFANGRSARSFHGDFMEAWDLKLLQDALDQCKDANGNVADCPVLAPLIDQASAAACVPTGQRLDENIGLDPNDPITVLPGCNPIWDGTGTQPGCPNPNAPTPPIVPAQVPLPSGWTEVGCVAEGSSGRALTGASTKSATMTRKLCLDFCRSKGFKLSGIEFGSECYCDSQLRNGASQTLLKKNQCSSRCGGNNYELCGGGQKLSLFTDANPGASQPSSASSSPAKTSAVASSIAATASPASSSARPSSAASPGSSVAATSTAILVAVPTPSNTTTSVPGLPAGWTAAGCVKDNVSGRTLVQDAYTSTKMTPAGCVAHCAQLGHPIAGVEYGVECYCGAAFKNGGGAPLAESACSMKCGGDASRVCGGPNALSLFKNTGAVKRRVHKARTFGKSHKRSNVF